jgi:hypothetical protein
MPIWAGTERLLGRIKLSIKVTMPPPTTALGNWYATVRLWKPQLAPLVNERTLLPILMPLAPASSLAARFSVESAAALSRHGASQTFVERELTLQ